MFMANRIKKIKVKTKDNILEDVFIAIDAENVELNGENEEIINLQEYIDELNEKLNNISTGVVEWNKDLDLT